MTINRLTRGRAVAASLGAALLLIVARPAAAADPMLADMIALDRAYVPLLVFSSEGKLVESRKAMLRLQRQYADFRQLYLDARRNDPAWRHDINYLGALVEEAAAILDGGTQVALVHEVVEHLHPLLTHLHQVFGAPYYLDYFYNLHEPADTIAMAAAGKTADTLGEADVSAMRSALALAQPIWDRAREDAPEPAFKFNAQQLDALRKLIATEDDALRALRQALDAGDKAAMLKSAAGVRPALFDIYVALGNFAAVK